MEVYGEASSSLNVLQLMMMIGLDVSIKSSRTYHHLLFQAYMYILNAEEYQPEQLFIEKAEMYWARGQHEHAFTTLRRGLEETYPQIDQLNPQQK